MHTTWLLQLSWAHECSPRPLATVERLFVALGWECGLVLGLHFGLQASLVGPAPSFSGAWIGGWILARPFVWGCLCLAAPGLPPLDYQSGSCGSSSSTNAAALSPALFRPVDGSSHSGAWGASRRTSRRSEDRERRTQEAEASSGDRQWVSSYKEVTWASSVWAQRWWRIRGIFSGLSRSRVSSWFSGLSASKPYLPAIFGISDWSALCSDLGSEGGNLWSDLHFCGSCFGWSAARQFRQRSDQFGFSCVAGFSWLRRELLQPGSRLPFVRQVLGIGEERASRPGAKCFHRAAVR